MGLWVSKCVHACMGYMCLQIHTNRNKSHAHAPIVWRNAKALCSRLGIMVAGRLRCVGSIHFVFGARGREPKLSKSSPKPDPEPDPNPNRPGLDKATIWTRNLPCLPCTNSCMIRSWPNVNDSANAGHMTSPQRPDPAVPGCTTAPVLQRVSTLLPAQHH